MILDDGGDLSLQVHKENPEMLSKIQGISEKLLQELKN
jgi:S-adenosylhomocysteine hydrolase